MVATIGGESLVEQGPALHVQHFEEELFSVLQPFGPEAKLATSIGVRKQGEVPPVGRSVFHLNEVAKADGTVEVGRFQSVERSPGVGGAVFHIVVEPFAGFAVAGGVGVANGGAANWILTNIANLERKLVEWPLARGLGSLSLPPPNLKTHIRRKTQPSPVQLLRKKLRSSHIEFFLLPEQVPAVK